MIVPFRYILVHSRLIIRTVSNDFFDRNQIQSFAFLLTNNKMKSSFVSFLVVMHTYAYKINFNLILLVTLLPYVKSDILNNLLPNIAKNVISELKPVMVPDYGEIVLNEGI